jgi:hypothetical protein
VENAGAIVLAVLTKHREIVGRLLDAFDKQMVGTEPVIGEVVGTA